MESPKKQLLSRLYAYLLECEGLTEILSYIMAIVENYLDRVPEAFWTAPASSSGKYHPIFSLGEGGLFRHTLLTMYWADEYSKMLDLSDYDRGVAVIAACLHDTCKGGARNVWGHTNKDHGGIAGEMFIITFIDSLVASSTPGDAPAGFFINVMRALHYHMGRWAPSEEAFSDLTPAQQCIVMADYAASRKVYDNLSVILEG